MAFLDRASVGNANAAAPSISTSLGLQGLQFSCVEGSRQTSLTVQHCACRLRASMRWLSRLTAQYIRSSDAPLAAADSPISLRDHRDP